MKTTNQAKKAESNDRAVIFLSLAIIIKILCHWL